MGTGLHCSLSSWHPLKPNGRWFSAPIPHESNSFRLLSPVAAPADLETREEDTTLNRTRRHQWRKMAPLPRPPRPPCFVPRHRASGSRPRRYQPLRRAGPNPVSPPRRRGCSTVGGSLREVLLYPFPTSAAKSPIFHCLTCRAGCPSVTVLHMRTRKVRVV
jgi:hypothetical protein